jgi:hypothetical protein
MIGAVFAKQSTIERGTASQHNPMDASGLLELASIISEILIPPQDFLETA